MASTGDPASTPKRTRSHGQRPKDETAQTSSRGPGGSEQTLQHRPKPQKAPRKPKISDIPSEKRFEALLKEIKTTSEELYCEWVILQTKHQVLHALRDQVIRFLVTKLDVENADYSLHKAKKRVEEEAARNAAKDGENGGVRGDGSGPTAGSKQDQAESKYTKRVEEAEACRNRATERMNEALDKISNAHEQVLTAQNDGFRAGDKGKKEKDDDVAGFSREIVISLPTTDMYETIVALSCLNIVVGMLRNLQVSYDSAKIKQLRREYEELAKNHKELLERASSGEQDPDDEAFDFFLHYTEIEHLAKAAGILRIQQLGDPQKQSERHSFRSSIHRRMREMHDLWKTHVSRPSPRR